MQPVMVYQPSAEKKFRVTWYGGQSTQLHFEKYRIMRDIDTDQFRMNWQDRDVRTFGGGVPAQIKDMLLEMENYYHEAIIMEQERIYQMI